MYIIESNLTLLYLLFNLNFLSKLYYIYKYFVQYMNGTFDPWLSLRHFTCSLYPSIFFCNQLIYLATSVKIWGQPEGTAPEVLVKMSILYFVVKPIKAVYIVLYK